MDSQTPGELPEKIQRKIRKVWDNLIGTPLETVSEECIIHMEEKLKELENAADTTKYFLANDKQATSVKTKPLTVKDFEQIKKRLEKIKLLIKDVWNDFYLEVKIAFVDVLVDFLLLLQKKIHKDSNLP